MKRVLIFYSATGGGHFRAAQAIEEEMSKRHPDYTVYLHDSLSVVNSGKPHAPDKTFHLFTTSLIKLYNLLFILTNTRIGVRIMKWVIKHIWGKSIARTIETFKPDIIITTHPSVSKTTVTLKTFPCPIIMVVTDLNKPHELWFDNRYDAILAPDELTASLIHKYHPHAKPKIVITGYPLKHQFQPVTTNHTLTHTLVLLGGGVGSGKLIEQTHVLATAFPHKKILVICGKNKDILETLEKAKYMNVEHYGFVDDMKKNDDAG